MNARTLTVSPKLSDPPVVIAKLPKVGSPNATARAAAEEHGCPVAYRVDGQISAVYHPRSKTKGFALRNQADPNAVIVTA